jgi:hypothetical protein
MSITAHRHNLLAKLGSDIRRLREDQGISTGHAFSRVAAEWLGYDLDEDNFIDLKDRGIDFWFQSDAGFDIFQTKGRELAANGAINLDPLDDEGVKDLQAAKQFLLTKSEIEGMNEKLKKFRHEWDHSIGTRRMSKEPSPIIVNLGLVVLADDLTTPARDAFTAFCDSLADAAIAENVPIEFRAQLYTVNDLLEARWRLDNREWRDNRNEKKDWIKLHPEKVEDLLSTANSAVFYCSGASDEGGH